MQGHPEKFPASEQKYLQDAAAHCMTKDVPTASESATLREVHDMLRHNASSFKTINYVYVLDLEKRLVGVVSIKELFQHNLDLKVADVCKKETLISVYPSTHQERAAYLALKYRIKSIPVLSREGVFLGEITSDSILRILHKETHEDSLKRAGIRHPDAVHSTVLTLSLFSSFRHRIPWLLLGLIGGLLTAHIISFFEATLSKNLVLAAFIPLIVYMSDAVGTQMEAYIIRDLALEQSLQIWHYTLRHFFVVMCIGLCLAVLLASSYGLFMGDWYLGFVLALSLFLSVCSSVCTGLLIPFAFSKFSLDPADASGPVATVLQDMISIVIYFVIASLML